MTGDDRDLYESFRALRRTEEADVPQISLRSLSTHKRGRLRLPGKLIAVSVCLGTMIAAAVWLLPGSRVSHKELSREQSNREQGQSVGSIASWKPATDFLLETPGRELLQSVPAIGEWHGVAIASRAGERRRHSSKQVLP